MRISVVQYLFAFMLILTCVFNSNAQVVINEIMTNPNSSNLPPYEYIELFNTGNKPIQLSTVAIMVNNNSAPLPSYLLAPQQYVIICSEVAQSSLERYGNAIALTRWFTLSNAGAKLKIMNGETIMDEVNYKNTWHSSTAQRNGGYSLERINPNWTCDAKENWTSTRSPNGGTPGSKNTVFNKNTSPSIIITDLKTQNNTLLITFNQSYDIISQLTETMFEVNQGIGNPTAISWNDEMSTMTLSFTNTFIEKEAYILRIKPFEICSFTVKIMDEPFFIQSIGTKNDIIISEILFNPRAGGFDFVEIYNTRPYPINLKNWKLGNRLLTEKFLLIEGQNYLAVTTNTPSLILQYPSSSINNITQVPSLPSYPNQQGSVTLFDDNNQLIDSIYYNAKMHDPLLSNVKGISLERQSLYANHPSFMIFKSSATLQEGATPGYANSTSEDKLYKKNIFLLRSKTVSPNGDSHEDNLEVSYTFTSSDYYMTVNIYNDKGVLINRLIRNQKAGNEGEITWNAQTETGQKVSAGHYILIAEIYTDKGNREHFKKAFVIVPNSLSY